MLPPTPPLGLPTDRAPQLSELLEVLDGGRVLDAARAIEAARTPTREGSLAAHHRLAVPGLTTTPLAYQAAAVARERGIVTFDRLERALLPPAPPWVHPEIGPDVYRTALRGDRLHAHDLWPLAQDCPAGDYQLGSAPKRFTDGLVRALVGFGWWGELSEWDVMHMARLSEAVAALHRYWLSELGRLHDDSPTIDLSRPDAHQAAEYLELEEQARDPQVRLARLTDAKARAIADNGLQTLRYEAYAYGYGMAHGVLVEPEPPSLAFGEATEYAKIHHRRLTGPAFERWLSHCLRADVDYATSPQAFDARAAAAVVALLTPLSPSDDVAAARADMVLRDLGQRLCHLAALREQASDGLEPQLTAIADGLAAVRGGHDDPDGVLAEVLERLAREVDQPADGPGAKELLALGYSPMTDPAREPNLAKASRAEALVRRAWAYHPVVGATLEGLKPLAARVVDGARTERLTEELRTHADPAAREAIIDYFAEAWIGWLDFLGYHWGPPDGRGNLEPRWQYRLSRRALPPKAERSRFVITLNPYLQKLPLPFSARWVAQLLDEPRGKVQPLRPRNATAVEYAYVGPGRRGPVFLPLTPELRGLTLKLKLPRRLDALIAERDLSAERVARAIEDELVLCFHKPEHEAPEWMHQQTDIIDLAGVQEQALEPEIDYWSQQRQVEAYERFADRSSLYRASSAELVDRAGVAGAQRIMDLGCGTGLTTAAALAQLGEEGVVIGGDPSKLMLERAKARIDDPRARFIIGGAMELGVAAARDGRPFDTALCNSALWLARDIKREAGRVRNALRDGGLFAFSTPAAFLGHNDHLMTPEFQVFAKAIADVRAAMGHDPEAVPLASDPALGDVDHMREVLNICAFDQVDFQLWSYDWPASEYIDWLSMPVVREGMVPPDARDQSERFIAMLRERLDPDLPLVNRWYMVVARASL
ncbi:MAG: hypothetical protein CSA66_01160 [Proteobacteria bacterium]|nr:MAG: hypothetical protein CSA66_01160 [Pseudomonadota bacterium]